MHCYFIFFVSCDLRLWWFWGVIANAIRWLFFRALTLTLLIITCHNSNNNNNKGNSKKMVGGKKFQLKSWFSESFWKFCTHWDKYRMSYNDWHANCGWWKNNTNTRTHTRTNSKHVFFTVLIVRNIFTFTGFFI